MSPPDAEASLPDAAEFDPLLVSILRSLHGPDDGSTSALAGLSLARLAKRTGLRQSTLRRNLTWLEDAGLVRVELDEAGGGRVLLTSTGTALIGALEG